MAIDKAVDSAALDASFTAIAAAIRAKNGSSDSYTPAQMPTAIANIPSGGGDTHYVGTVTGDPTGTYGKLEYTFPKYGWFVLVCQTRPSTATTNRNPWAMLIRLESSGTSLGTLMAANDTVNATSFTFSGKTMTVAGGSNWRFLNSPVYDVYWLDDVPAA